MYIWGKVLAGILGIILLLFALGLGILTFNVFSLLAIQKWIVDCYMLLHRGLLNQALSVIGVVLLVVGAVALFRTLFPRGRFLIYRTDEGEIKVSFDSLHSLTREALKGMEEIISVTPRVEKRGQSARLFLHLVVRTDASIPELSNIVQTKVRERIERQTGIALDDVKLLVDLQPKEQPA
ncbi:MAG: alkaline shock response membrane anchor protein AmaP [Candidatus Caldatribacteriaceae bacterium]